MILFTFLGTPLLVGETALEGSQEFLPLVSLNLLLPAALILHRLLPPPSNPACARRLISHRVR
jgi:hypothetical protein